MVHSSLHELEQDGKVGDSGWLDDGEPGVVPWAAKEILDTYYIRYILDIKCQIKFQRGNALKHEDKPVEEEKAVW